MDTYAKRFSTRPGGFTRIIPIGNRLGDHAPMAVIEILNTEEPESEVSFSYLVRSLATMQLKEETKIVNKALAPAPAEDSVYADKRSFKKALDEHRSKEKFALKIKKAMKNASLSADQLQEIVDRDMDRAKVLHDKETGKSVHRFAKDTWPENTPALE
ncbi:54S ribosomal protein L8, mitochondrial [Coemansia sp. S17]|nr:54S ribosomal protein L8, mitochondrial [Coemansia sp. S17]